MALRAFLTHLFETKGVKEVEISRDNAKSPFLEKMKVKKKSRSHPSFSSPSSSSLFSPPPNYPSRKESDDDLQSMPMRSTDIRKDDAMILSSQEAEPRGKQKSSTKADDCRREEILDRSERRPSPRASEIYAKADTGTTNYGVMELSLKEEVAPSGFK
eukprot:scaffold5794_cov141-Cylindrotheca_fusiformis.AAC.5